MSLKAPSRGERHLSLESLESRQMMSGTALTAMQQETVQAAGMILRDDPVTLLSGEKEFNGSTVECIADSPVFTDGSFMIEVSVRPNAIRGQTFVSKYDSHGAQDQGFYLGMYPDGRLQFSVYGNGGDYRLLNTTEAPLVVGKWQKIRASFDIQSQKMSITVDGREIPATIPPAASKEIRTIHDGSSPVRVGASVWGGPLPTDFFGGELGDATFYPVSQYGIPQQAAAASPSAVDAAIAEEEAILPLTEAEPPSLESDVAEANALTTTQELTSGAVQTVLTAKDTVALQNEWNREQEEFRTAEGRTTVLLGSIEEDRDALSNLQKDLSNKRTALAEKETSLKQCQDALEPLAADVRRLTDLSTALTNEQQSLPGRIAALEQQAADGQKVLQDTIAARDATERTLTSIRQQAKQGEKDYSYQLKVYRQNWRNKALLNKVNALRANIDNLYRQEQLLQTESTNLSKKAVECQNALSSTTTELTSAKTRQAALPGELSGTIAARDTAEARLGTLPGEETRLASEIAALRASVSAQAAEADLLSQRITGAKNDLPTAFLTEAHEWQDVEQMRRTVDAALLSVFEEDLATDGASQLQVEATEDTQSLSLTERQLQQYRTRMAAAQERLAECEKNLDTAQERALALDEIVPGESDPAKKADLASLVPHVRMTEDQALSDWQIARRETIAYAGITAIEPHVTQDRNGQVSVTFSVHYRSPDTESCMEVYRDGVRVQETLLRHPAGERDGEFDFNPGDSGSSGDLEFRYSSRGAEGIKNAGRATARYNTRELPRNAASVGTTFSAVESRDTGRLVDTPLPYALKIMSTNGPSAVLHFTSPDDESVIVSSTGGLYGEDRHSHTGGTSTGVSLVTLNPTKIGRYSFFIMDQSGTPRCSIAMDWDGTTLTCANQDDQWTSEAATIARTASLAANNPDASPALRIATSLSEEAAETLEQERLELRLAQEMSLTNGIDISSMNRELARIQAEDLYCTSGLFLSMEKMHEYFYTVHPDWRPENFQATVMRMWEAGNRKEPSGHTRDALNDIILDVLGRYDRDLGVYDAAMCEILQKGIDVCLKIRQGSPEGPLFQELEGLITARGYWEAVERLKGIGVNLPDRHQVIDEARHIIETRLVDLVFRQSEDARLRANYDLRQQANATWAAEHDGLNNVSVLTVRKTVAGGYTQKEVSESEKRRIDRALRTFKEIAGLGNNDLVQIIVDASNQPNIQRQRQSASGITQIALTPAEAETIATEMEKTNQEVNGDATIMAKGMMSNPEVEVIATLVRNIGKIPAHEGKSGTEWLQPLKGKESSFTFTLEGSMMVNLWMEPGSLYVGGFAAPTRPNYTLILTGTTADGRTVGPYTHNKPAGSAESVSSALPAGTYTLTLRDDTVYPSTAFPGTSGKYEPPAAPVKFEMKPYKTQKIEGRISIENREVTMPVSMGVAEFDPNTGYRLPEAKNSLDPSKPVWVVVHGRRDSENGNNINFLAKSLWENGYQVVTLNWEEAARNNSFASDALRGADWIPEVGRWATNQLKAAGFSGEKVIMAGHSWGSLVAYEVGKNFKNGPSGNSFGIQAIVAMDTPLDALPNDYPINDVVFNDVTRTSWAFRSSIFGSEARSNTASYNFELPGLYDDLEGQLLNPEQKVLADAAEAYFGEHGYAVSYFANLVNGLGGSSMDAIDIERLIQGQMLNLSIDPSAPEGFLPYVLQQNTGPQGTYWQAVPTYLQKS
ncbi:MAG: LamG-like jellyroll fold domain-containing protein [Candidatus Peribacter sp.]|nr:LamG-like jellyroll fold domain-containing protein [Candidatus Peribacter sp.]